MPELHFAYEKHEPARSHETSHTDNKNAYVHLVHFSVYRLSHELLRHGASSRESLPGARGAGGHDGGRSERKAKAACRREDMPRYTL